MWIHSFPKSIGAKMKCEKNREGFELGSPFQYPSQNLLSFIQLRSTAKLYSITDKLYRLT